MGIDVRQAVKIAREQARQLLEREAVDNLALEEVEFDESDSLWLVTLGYDSPHIITRKIGPSLFPTTEEERKREYKVFRIDANNGGLRSMRIRDV